MPNSPKKARLFLVAGLLAAIASTATVTAHLTEGNAEPISAPTPTPTATGSCPTPTATVDLTTTRVSVGPDNLGVSLSMFGTPLPNSANRIRLLDRLGIGTMRIPVYWDAELNASYAGVPKSGQDEIVQVAPLLETVRNLGAAPYVVIIGKTGDLAFSPDDAAAVVRELAPLGVHEFGIGNEPGNEPARMTIEETIDFFDERAQEMRAVDSTIIIGGPNWAWFDPENLPKFAQEADYDFLVFHQYAMGIKDLAVESALSSTDDWSTNVALAQKWLVAAGKTDPTRNFVMVGELNWSWRYDSSSYSRSDAFQSSDIIVWATSVLGNILTVDGRAVVYADQNGPIGVLSQPSPHDTSDEYDLNPLYHGIGAWTGEGVFPGLRAQANLYKTTSDTSGVDVYAVDNSRGGINVIIVNKTKNDVPMTVSVPEAGSLWGVYTIGADDPQAKPAKTATITSCDAKATSTVTKRSVTVLVSQN